jgi:hypothetical protein
MRGRRRGRPESARFIAYLAPDRQVAKGASCDRRATRAFSAPPFCGGEIVSNERRGSVRSGFPGWRPLEGFRNGHDSAISRSERDSLEAPPRRGGRTSRSNARCAVYLRQSRPRPAVWVTAAARRDATALSAKQPADRDHPILDREIGHATAIGRRSPADVEPRRRLAEIPVRPRWNRVIGLTADPSSLARPTFRTRVRPDDV